MELSNVTIEDIITYLRGELIKLAKTDIYACQMLLARDGQLARGVIESDDENLLLETNFDILSKTIPHSAIPELLTKFCANEPPFKAPLGSIIFLALNAFWSNATTGAGGMNDTILIVYQTGQTMQLWFKEDGVHVRSTESLEELWTFFRFVPVSGTKSGDDTVWN